MNTNNLWHVFSLTQTAVKERNRGLLKEVRNELKETNDDGLILEHHYLSELLKELDALLLDDEKRTQEREHETT